MSKKNEPSNITKQEHLSKINWEEKIPEYIAIGINICKKFELYKNKAINGASVEDIVYTAINKLFNGREWNPEKVNIDTWMIMTIKSEVSNLFKKQSAINENDSIDDFYETIVINPSYNNDDTDEFSDPLKILIRKEDCNLFYEDLLELASKDEIVEKIICAIMDGIENKPSTLAKHLDIDIKEVYNASKRINRLFPKFQTMRKSHEE